MNKLGTTIDNDTVKWIPGYEKMYAARIDGEIISYKGLKPRVMKQSYCEKGYKKVNLYKSKDDIKHIKVHRLIGFTFIENIEPELFTQIDHIDMNPGNNSYTNLRWCTSKMNIGYSYKIKHGESWEPKAYATKEEIETRKIQREIKKQEKIDTMPYGSREAMIQKTSKPVFVNNILYQSAREAAKMICSDIEITATAGTVRKEIQNYINGKRKSWIYKGKYKIGD